MLVFIFIYNTVSEAYVTPDDKNNLRIQNANKTNIPYVIKIVKYGAAAKEKAFKYLYLCKYS